MDSNKKDILYLNVTLNRKKERSAIIMDVLENLPNKSRSDFVKTAILYYIQNNQPEHEQLAQLIKHSLQEVLIENGMIESAMNENHTDQKEDHIEIEKEEIKSEEEKPIEKKVNNDKLSKLASRFSN